MVNDFRYSSSWDQFEETVKTLKDLIEQKKAFWMIGFINDVDVLVDESEFELSKEAESIIDDEIIYLMRGILMNKEAGEEDIKQEMRLSYPDISEEELDESVVSIYNKRELVKDAFDVDRLLARYKLKNISLNHKLSHFNYNIYTHNLSNKEKIKCALLNVSSQKKLTKNDKEEDISFVCDTEDIDILIYLLKVIKKSMEEC